jgi:hypothetical protein
MHAIVDIVAALAAFALVSSRRRLWELLRRAADQVANSWREWRWRGVRVLGYALYAGIAGTTSFLLSNTLAGGELLEPLTIVHVVGLVGAGLWAQRLEGSSKLARPFGFYGSLLGAAAAIVVVGQVTGETLRLLAAMAATAPWVQAIGRLRCLVQGCCHGREAPESVGIRYRDPRSRAAALAGCRDVPLHPTPLYSILGNLVLGVVLLRLWSVGATFGLIAGVYLLLGGIARFVEESYRGEPQTPVIGGLRVYQWLAVISAVAGAAVTTLGGGTAGTVSLVPAPAVIGFAVLFGALTAFAMGVDFPGSPRRFARLAPP